MTPEEFDDLLVRVDAVKALVAKGQKLTAAQVATLDEGMRCSRVPLAERDAIGVVLSVADRAHLIPGQLTPPPSLPAQSTDEVAALVKKVKRGDHVWFEYKGSPRRGQVNKVMARTVCIEVLGEKDLQVPKSMLLAVEES